MGRSSGSILIAHCIYSFRTGGIENGVVNLINRLPEERYRHLIICLDYSSDVFARRLRKPVPIVCLEKRPGHDWGMQLRLWRVLRQYRPDVLHTRNLPTLEGQIAGWLACVPLRVHGEHGRDIYDLHGRRLKYQLWRKILRPFVHHYSTVSQDLALWLQQDIGIAPRRVTQIYNGVDVERFHPIQGDTRSELPPGFANPDSIVVGSVGRMELVKHQIALVQGFIRLATTDRKLGHRLRLVLVGDGSQRCCCEEAVRRAGLERFVWFAGDRTDIPELLRCLDIFVLTSLGEGISNTILEAMATGLPVIATKVGGNAELVRSNETGVVIPQDDPDALATAIEAYACNPAVRRLHGGNGRARVETEFSMHAMMRHYGALYDMAVKGRG